MNNNPLQRLINLCLWLIPVLLMLHFALAAVFRRLNFDESLALRSGWLLFGGYEASPPFSMPFTQALGVLSHMVYDPGTVFLIARLAVVFTLIPVAIWAFRTSSQYALPITLSLMFTSYVFSMHGLEFRYDHAVTLGLLVGYGCLIRSGPKHYLILGLAIAWLACHHLKGVFYGGALYGAAWLNLWFDKQDQRACLVRLHLAVLGGLIFWVFLGFVTGQLEESIRLFKTFFGVASSSEKFWPWQSLGPSFRKDLIFWVGAFILIICTTLRFKSFDTEQKRRSLVGFFFAMIGVAFLFVHPHPWPYLLTSFLPFWALLAAEELTHQLGEGRWKRILSVALILLIGHLLISSHLVFNTYFAAMSPQNAQQVSSLRLLRELAVEGDTVLDPSGLAYFLPPAHPDWYSDTLFREKAMQGKYMIGLEEVIPSNCTWALNTYRVSYIHPKIYAEVRRSYKQIGGGLLLHRDDPRIKTEDHRQQLPYQTLENFW